MRILMLSWEYPPRIVGGISRVVYDLAQKLGAQGNEVHVVTCMTEGVREFEKDLNVYVHRVNIEGPDTHGDFLKQILHMNFAMITRATEIIDEIGKFDVIHAHDWLVAYSAKTLKHAYKIPLVSTIHATEKGRNSGIYTDMQRYIHESEWWLCYESWKVICNSYYMKNEIINNWNVPESKIEIIFNGVNLNKFDGIYKDMEFRRRYAADNEKIVFFVGRLVREKGVQVLVDAAPKICQYYNDTKIVIAGKGPQMDELKKAAWDIGLGDRILFTGYMGDKELLKLYKCADVAVFPSLYEPFGIVALEAMVAEVPVVVSQAGGLGEIINHGHDGMKAYTGNANSLADCVLELLYNHDNIAGRVSKNAKDRVTENYNWDKISAQTYDVYKGVVEDSNNTYWDNVTLKEGLKEINDKKIVRNVLEGRPKAKKIETKKEKKIV